MSAKIEYLVTRKYIPVFHFRVTFINANPSEKSIPVEEITFTEVNGFNMEMQTEDVISAGENNYVYHLPKNIKTQNLVLKRADIQWGSPLIRWAEKAINDFDFELKHVVVQLLNEYHIPVKIWLFTDAYPVKINYSTLNAAENKIVIETLELAYKHAEHKDLSDVIGSIIGK